jgi:imidazole glycerol-phosphate synthase subunit HisH
LSALEVSVVDYGSGNLLGVRRGLEYCGAQVEITSDPDRILAAQRVVLPGVGAFANAMHCLDALGLAAAVREIASRGTPLLCICLGMQLLLDESEEFGITRGLGLIPGRVVPVPPLTAWGEKHKIPHIGWSALRPSDRRECWEGTLLEDNVPGDPVYFVHSFIAVPSNPDHQIAECDYGGHRLPAVIGRAQITGCQFHPEKSGQLGLKVLRRFLMQ